MGSVRVGRGEDLARKRKTKITFQPEPFRRPLGFDQPGERGAHLVAFGSCEALQEIAECTRLRPFQQGAGVDVDVDESSQVTAIVDESGSRKQLPELLIRRAEDR